MKEADVVRMTNQIADYWSVYPKAEALDGIAKHIHGSWEPRMRNILKAYIDKGGKGMSPLFLEAMEDYFKGPKTPSSNSVSSGKAPTKSAAPAATVAPRRS
jgi:formate dehydrogenase subunit delta